MQPLSREKLKDVRKLGSRKHRLETGRFVCEGIKLVGESDCTEYIVVSESFRGAIPDNVPCYHLIDSLFNDIAQTATPQGILAVCKQKAALEVADISGVDAVLMCDAVTDPGNLGTMIRTAENAGIGAVVLSEGCVDVYNAKVVRATMGAIFRVPIVVGADLAGVLREGGWRGIAMLSDGDADIYDVDMRGRVALVVGSEAHGVSEAVKLACEVRARIPMSGGESLNAGVAAGVAVYEWRRQTR